LAATAQAPLDRPAGGIISAINAMAISAGGGMTGRAETPIANV